MFDSWLQSQTALSPTLLSPLLLEASHLAPDDMTAFFRSFLKTLFCESRAGCEHCKPCKKLSKGFHPDVLLLTEVPTMETLRQALHQLHYQPFESSFRALAMPLFGSASRNVQNACLKTLEEPSAHWILLLGTQSRETVLDTVRSRSLFWQIPHTEAAPLSGEDEKLFNSLADRRDLDIFVQMDARLKDRDQSRELFTRLLAAASQRAYPGHWRSLAPWLEEALILLSRNLHPKTLWDRSWAQSLATAERASFL